MYKSNEPAKLFGVIEKNSAEEIRFSVVKWHEKNYVDVRVWIKADPSEGRDEIATKKGVRFHIEILPEFIRLLQRIDADLAGEPPETKEENDEERKKA
jgi:hypothetical protein